MNNINKKHFHKDVINTKHQQQTRPLYTQVLAILPPFKTPGPLNKFTSVRHLRDDGWVGKKPDRVRFQ